MKTNTVGALVLAIIVGGALVVVYFENVTTTHHPDLFSLFGVVSSVATAIAATAAMRSAAFAQKQSEQANRANTIAIEGRRPWLKIESVSLDPSNAWLSVHDQVQLNVRILARNLGITPARDVRIRTSLIPLSTTYQLDQLISKHSQKISSQMDGGIVFPNEMVGDRTAYQVNVDDPSATKMQLSASADSFVFLLIVEVLYQTGQSTRSHRTGEAYHVAIAGRLPSTAHEVRFGAFLVNQRLSKWAD